MQAKNIDWCKRDLIKIQGDLTCRPLTLNGLPVDIEDADPLLDFVEQKWDEILFRFLLILIWRFKMLSICAPELMFLKGQLSSLLSLIERLSRNWY